MFKMEYDFADKDESNDFVMELIKIRGTLSELCRKTATKQMDEKEFRRMGGDWLGEVYSFQNKWTKELVPLDVRVAVTDTEVYCYGGAVTKW